MNRRRFLAWCSAAIGGASAGCLQEEWKPTEDTTSDVRSGTAVGVEEFEDGFDEPLAVSFLPGGEYQYVAERRGEIRFLEQGTLRQEPLIDLSDRLVELEMWEQGVLGLALHPNFTDNRKFYVRYSAPLRADDPTEFSHVFTLSEFEASQDFRRVVSGSERILLEIPEPDPAHNAGDITFGPDGYLYVPVGMGGHVVPNYDFILGKGGSLKATVDSIIEAGPGYAQDWYFVNRGDNGQDITKNLMGSILRIDVNNAENGKPYAIPDDNPLVGKEGLDEQYAWGFRNPYRMSFDGNRLLVGDVGAASYEEINLVEKGGNYGWIVREGFSCHNRNQAFTLLNLESVPLCPTNTPSGEPLRDPVVTYPHHKNGQRFGTAVIGGYVYRGSTVKSLQGKYVFGDIYHSNRIFAAEMAEEKTWPIQEVPVVGSGTSGLNGFILSFGKDLDGEVYILTTQFSEGTGKIYKLTSTS